MDSPEEIQRPLKIREAADKLGVRVHRLRYLEQIGLVVPSGKSWGGQKRYTESDLWKVRLIEFLEREHQLTAHQAHKMLPLLLDVMARFPIPPHSG